ncbi:MAG TPA: hypothetical protein PLC17_02220 [Tenuifilaceae bacterium]|jgi:hypothetical protein|nr:hypothetical protein [Tenuifilaceae bacterium]HPX04724.1 hypothetical protein [Tenuifilaceae bacterium]HQB77363.1 hypothetical protein [Tenuifilaceae bacterium]
MVIISGQAFGQSICKGSIYYFKSNKLIETAEPHYFIVIANSPNDVVIFTCCTSQFEKRVRFIEINNIPRTTLVWIKPNEDNCLKKDSFVDCNSYFQYSKAELIQMYEMEQIKFVGYINDSEIEQIRQGLKDSPLVDVAIKEII